MQGDMMWDVYFPEPGSNKPAFSNDELPLLLTNTLAATARAAPGEKLTAIRFNLQGNRARADVGLATTGSRELSFDARTGEVFDESAPGAEPKSLRARLWTVMIKLHRGDIVGVTGQWLGLVCGLALLTLAITGVVLYLQLFRHRAKSGRHSLFW